MIALSTDIFTMSFAFWRAPSLSSLCTQESMFLMLAMSRRYGLSPARLSAPWKVGEWVFGEQAATTTRLICLSRMTALMSLSVLAAQEYVWSWACTTFGSVLAKSRTDLMSTTPAMLDPQ